ncbi:integrator complex subunit 2-like [Littorina saxatilis]|uniref:Integrator complex subunit 2 n=1 Tax=Littorina saxatilis TaxID=31220 RepID=A0AAN9AHX0_9CAEN
MATLRSKMKMPVKTHVFEAMQSIDIDALGKCSESDLRPVLPALVRMALCQALDSSDRGDRLRTSISVSLSGLEVVNNIVGLLSIDFHSLEQDVKKEQQLRAKAGGNPTESVLIMQLPNGLALEFERSDAARRIRLILSQLFFVISELKEGRAGNFHKTSELFDCPVYLEEVSDILCIAHAELPGLLQLGEVAEALLCLSHGPQLLCQMIANFPESFVEVCKSLVLRGEKVEEDSVGGCRRLEMLQMLAAMNPKDALSIRALCVEHCTMPGLAVSLSLQMSSSSSRGTSSLKGNDVVSFISSLLLGSDQTVRNWFAQFVKAAQKRHRDAGRKCVLQSLRKYLLQQLKDLIAPGEETMPESSVVQASALIRLYSALKGIATLKYSEEEMKYLLQLITSQPPLSHAGTRFVTLAVCVIISSANLLSGIDEEQLMISWIRKLLAKENEFEKEDGGTSSFGEMLFLVALHFHSNQTAAISELVCNTLGMKSIVKTSSLTRLRNIFTHEIFTEQVIAAHAVKIPVTPGLSATHTGYLPIHSIHQLLKSRVFSRHKVPIKDWIHRQLIKSALPIHPLLPQLIDCFVSTILPKGLKVEQTNQPFEESEILAVYSDFLNSSKTVGFKTDQKMETGETTQAAREGTKEKGENLAPQLLMLYYVLLYQDTLLSVSKSPVLSLRPHVSYSVAVMSQIPINYLVQEAQRRQQQCAAIYSALLKLLVTHYPHLCLVEDWLEDSLSLASSSSSSSSNEVTALPPPTSSGVPLSQAAFKTAVSCVVENPALALSQLNAMLRLSPVDLQKFADPLVTSLPSLLGDSVPRKILDLVQRVWFKCHSLTPRRLRLATVNALQVRQTGTLKTEIFSEQDVMVDPLVVLRCDERVFRCPPVLAIMLRVLSAYIQASRLFLHQTVTANTGVLAAATSAADATKVEKERMELKNALVSAQESACLQILLEVCLTQPQEMETVKGELKSLREVRCAVFSFIHQAFIQEPHLAKLIHFQGYPSELLPLMVAGVPSMHICLDFIPELLGQPQTEKQVFGTQLLAALCSQYPLPKTMNVARLAINVMFTVLSTYESHVWCKMFVHTVPSILLMCRAFPPLCEDVTALLIQIARVCRSQLAVSSNTAVTDPIKMDGPAPKLIKLMKCAKQNSSSPNFHHLLALAQETFQQITIGTSVGGRLY